MEGERETPATGCRPGAVLEFSTPRGFAYAQYAGDGTEDEQLLRILPGLHDERPRDLEELAARKERFWEQVELSAVLEDGLAAVVGMAEVPVAARRHPTFRTPGLPDPFAGVIRSWRLWDDRTVTIVPVDELTDEQRALSVGGYSTRDDLLERIAQEWEPSSYELEPIEPRADAADLRVTHESLYPSKPLAEDAARALAAAGFLECQVARRHGDWSVTAQEPALTWDQSRSERTLERVAREIGGEYYGYGYPTADAPDIGTVRHRLQFAEEEAARSAAGRLDREWFEASVEAEGGKWLVTASEPLSYYDADESDEIMEDLADTLGGTCLGAEVQRRAD